MLLLRCDVNELVSFILVLIKEMVVLSLEAEICTVFRMGFHKGLQVDHAVGNGSWRRLLGLFIAASACRQGARHEEGSAMVYTQFLYFMRRPYFLLSEEAADAAEEEAAEERDFERESVTSFVMSVPP